MNNKLISIVLTLVVGIILAGSVLVPVLDDATATEKTFDNRDGALFQLEKFDESTEYSFEWVYTDPTHATVNNETVTLSRATVICATDSFLIRYGQDSSNGYYLQAVGGSLGSVYGNVNSKTTLTISVSSGTLTATVANEGSSPTSKTVSITEGYGIVANGGYVMKASNQTAYVLADSPIMAMGLTSLDGVWSNMFQIVGNVEGVEVTQINPTPATYTISNVAVNVESSASYIDLYELQSITFDATLVSDNTTVHACTYDYFIVPAEVTAELSEHLTPGQIALMGAIPVLVIVALLVVAVGVVARRND